MEKIRGYNIFYMYIYTIPCIYLDWYICLLTIHCHLLRAISMWFHSHNSMWYLISNQNTIQCDIWLVSIYFGTITKTQHEVIEPSPTHYGVPLCYICFSLFYNSRWMINRFQLFNLGTIGYICFLFLASTKHHSLSLSLSLS